MITVQKAYKIAKQYQNNNWIDNAQIQLRAVGESEKEWIFSFIPFIPKEKNERTNAYWYMVHGILGYEPLYYGVSMLPVEVDKETGNCCMTWFHSLDADKAEEYYSKYTQIEVSTVFAGRKSKGCGYSIREIGKNVHSDLLEET